MESTHVPASPDDGAEMESLLRDGNAEGLFLGILVKLQRYRASRKASYAAALDMGRLLLRAREMIAHGDFGAACENIGLQPRTANNFMRLAAAGFDADQIASLGGIRKSLDGLAIPKSENFSDLPDPEDDSSDIYVDDQVDQAEPSTPPHKRAPSRADVLQAELATAISRIDGLQLRAKFEEDPEKLIAALEVENRTMKSRINDLVREVEDLRSERDRLKKRTDGLADLVSCCVNCHRPVIVEDLRCPQCDKVS